MTNKHTAGPWKLQIDEDTNQWEGFVGTDDVSVATVLTESISDAKLITKVQQFGPVFPTYEAAAAYLRGGRP